MILDGIHITIVKTARRKTVSIFIERDGSIRVLAPIETSTEKIETVVRAKEYQIFKKLAEWKELNLGKVSREFVNGQSFLYLGRNYRLAIEETLDVPLKVSGGYFRLDKKYLAKAKTVFKDFYKQKTEQKITERLSLIQEKFSRKPTAIKVLDLQNRWASWTTNDTLNFHWKCIMAPVPVLDYIIVHEMIHLKYPNHSKNFWNELDKKMPNYREYEEWLKKNGVKMDL